MPTYIDINECASDNGGCDHTCTNTKGSYYCTCKSGYELHSDEHSCNGRLCYFQWINSAMTSMLNDVSIFIYHVDVNECDQKNGGCEQNCGNTEGSFECSCNSGYQLELDGAGCERKKQSKIKIFLFIWIIY